MAVDVNGPYGNRQATPYEVVIRRTISNSEIRELLDWCKDPEHPGCFRHCYDSRQQAMLVGFTDEMLAFQCKIRWG